MQKNRWAKRVEALEAERTAAIAADTPIVLTPEQRADGIHQILGTYEVRCEMHGAPEDPEPGSADWRAQQILLILDTARTRKDAREAGTTCER